MRRAYVARTGWARRAGGMRARRPGGAHGLPAQVVKMERPRGITRISGVARFLVTHSSVKTHWARLARYYKSTCQTSILQVVLP